MKTVTLLLAATILLLPLASADLGLETQNFPTLKAPAKALSQINNNTLNVNNSQFLQGYTPATLPLSAAFTSNVSSSFVPYLGANKNVNLNDFNLTNVQRIGIGTATPNYGLDIRGITAINTTNAQLNMITSNTGQHYYLQVVDNGGRFRIYDQTANTERIALLSDGNVGIGTTTPSRRLDVRGVGNFSGELYVQNGTAVSPWLYNQSFDTSNLSSYVPYVGASGNVDLNSMNLTTNSIIINGSIIALGNGTDFGIQKPGSYIFGSINASPITNSIAYIQSAPSGSFNQIQINMAEAINSSSIVYNPTGVQPSYIQGFISMSGNNNNRSARFGTISSGTYVGGMAVVSGINSTADLGIFNLVSAQGSFIYGRVNTAGNNRNASLTVGSAGSFANGYAQDSTIRAGNSPSHQSAFVQGYASGQNSSLRADASAALVQGRVSGVHSSIVVSGTAGIAQGYVEGVNSSILSSANGAISHGYILGPNNFIIASGTGAVAIGLPNMSVSGAGSAGFGRNVNVTGANTFAFGAGTTMQTIAATSSFIISEANVGIRNYTPTYPLTVSGNVSGISGWFEGNVSAAGYLTRTDVYDKVKSGAAVPKLKDSSQLVYANGKPNHKAFGYSYVNYTVKEQVGVKKVLTPYQDCYTEYDEKTEKDKEVCEWKEQELFEPIYANVFHEAVDLTKEVAWLRQVAYEQQQTINSLESRIAALEASS